MELLQLIKQGIELLVEGALLALDGDHGREQAIDRFLSLAKGGHQDISGRRDNGLRCGDRGHLSHLRVDRPRNKSNHYASGI